MRCRTVVGLLAAWLVVLQAAPAVAGVQDLEVGGRFIQDWTVWGAVDEALGVSSEDATEVRSAYVSAKGRLGSHLRFKADYDVAGGEVGVKDVYLEAFGVPGVGHVRVGHWVVPAGLDNIVSTKNLSFLESGSCMAFAPGRNTGLMVWNSFADGRVTAELGAFRDVNDVAEAEGSGEGGSVAGRLTGLLVNQDGGRRLVHLAVSGIVWDPKGDAVRFRARPELHQADYFVDTGSMDAESARMVGLEIGGVVGPAHFQGEHLMANVKAREGDGTATGRAALQDDAGFSGYSVQAGYFLTGESRGYKGTSFDRTKVTRELLDGGGWGAWEVLARYSRLDLNGENAGVAGGRMDNITFGLSWYLSSYAKVMANYVMATVTDQDGEEVGKATALATRMQFDF